MKKVLIVSGSLRVGGLETVAMNCMRYANKEKYTFDFLVYGDEVGEYEREAIVNNCNVIHIDKPSNNFFKFYNNLCKIMNDYGPFDIVHSHTFFNSGIVMRAAKKCGIPKRVAHAHSVKRSGSSKNYKYIYNFLMRTWLKKYSTDLCACSQQAGEYVFSKNEFLKRGIIFPNTINITDFSYSMQNRNKIFSEFGIKDEQIVLGQIGHLTISKNQLFLLELFAEYKKTHNAVLLLVGDGELSEQLKEKAKKLGIYENVIMPGTRQDVGDLLSAMDVFVCTSKNEGFGIVLLEAQANGLPCVIENHVLVQEIRCLKNCYEVDGFEHTYKWINSIDEAISRGRSQKVVDILRNSKYSIDYFSKQLENLYK